MLISVSSISSETVIILELGWKPRWVMIMSVNSLAVSVQSPLACGVSLCYNVDEKVFAINVRRAEALSDLSLRASHTQESISAPERGRCR